MEVHEYEGIERWFGSMRSELVEMTEGDHDGPVNGYQRQCAHSALNQRIDLVIIHMVRVDPSRRDYARCGLAVSQRGLGGESKRVAGVAQSAAGYN